MNFERSQVQVLRQRLEEPPALLLVVTGPRQVGKSTAVRQALSERLSTYVPADDPLPSLTPSSVELDGSVSANRIVPGSQPTSEWLVHIWSQARAMANSLPYGTTYILAIDEIQKVPRWSEVVKGLWDADRAARLALHVVLLGSSPWLMQKGLTESLAGRYELIPLNHWSYSEMQAAFDFSLDEYLFFGGYPGGARFIRDETRWRAYVRGSLIQPNIEKDILQMTRVDKPVLLKTMFELGCAYSGQIISYTKLQGQLQDAGNTVTLAHYLELLSQAGLLTGLAKYAVRQHRQRASSPKLNALNTGLISALAGYTFAEARNDRSYWGRLVESAIGAHLCNTARGACEIYYWRESPHEVDFVVVSPYRLVVIEVKSRTGYGKLKGIGAFLQLYKDASHLIVGEGGIPLTEFLSHPAARWLE